MNIKLKSFTMAEILLSLTIIGVVAAITLPSLTGNINERTWNTQRKALYARISQAIPLMGSLNGYGIGATESETASNAAKIFVTNGVAKVYKINNICDSEHLQDCGIVSKYISTKGTKKDFPKTLRLLNNSLISQSGYQHPVQTDVGDIAYSHINTYISAFETTNGESVAVFYNPFCRQDLIQNKTNVNGNAYIYTAPMLCVNFVFDLNGKKGPNTIGKDMGIITAFYPTDTNVVMPTPLADNSVNSSGSSNMNYNSALTVCKNSSNDIRLPNREELASLAINRTLLDFEIHQSSGTNYAVYAATKNWQVEMARIAWTNMGYGSQVRVRCIKR